MLTGQEGKFSSKVSVSIEQDAGMQSSSKNLRGAVSKQIEHVVHLSEELPTADRTDPVLDNHNLASQKQRWISSRLSLVPG